MAFVYYTYVDPTGAPRSVQRRDEPAGVRKGDWSRALHQPQGTPHVPLPLAYAHIIINIYDETHMYTYVPPHTHPSVFRSLSLTPLNRCARSRSRVPPPWAKSSCGTAPPRSRRSRWSWAGTPPSLSLTTRTWRMRSMGSWPVCVCVCLCVCIPITVCPGRWTDDSRSHAPLDARTPHTPHPRLHNPIHHPSQASSATRARRASPPTGYSSNPGSTTASWPGWLRRCRSCRSGTGCSRGCSRYVGMWVCGYVGVCNWVEGWSISCITFTPRIGGLILVVCIGRRLVSSIHMPPLPPL